MTKIELLNGKYTVIHENGRGLRALRYGEEWRNLTGDNLVMAMAQEIEELREGMIHFIERYHEYDSPEQMARDARYYIYGEEDLR